MWDHLTDTKLYHMYGTEYIISTEDLVYFEHRHLDAIHI